MAWYLKSNSNHQLTLVSKDTFESVDDAKACFSEEELAAISSFKLNSKSKAEIVVDLSAVSVSSARVISAKG